MKSPPLSPPLIVLLAAVLFVRAAAAQPTKILLATMTPGTEQVQLVPNGNFQQPGLPVGGTYPNPAGWNRSGRMYVSPGLNMFAADQGVVAQGLASPMDPVSGYVRSLTLEAATEYVLSAYLWNLGDANNHVTTVVDLNDAPAEAQLTLNASDPMANRGYFVYARFNTSTTGTNITLRCFYDGLSGAGVAPQYSPVGAQWDNIAITRADLFEAGAPHSRLFCNPARITIPDINQADPYPSTINISNLDEPITKVTVTLSDIGHTYLADLDVLLVSPGGPSVLLMSDAGGTMAGTLTFDDSAPDSLPPLGLAVSPGRYRPTDYPPGDEFMAPAPPGPYGADLSVFNGTLANGEWRLFVWDDAAHDLGAITNGWKLLITTAPLAITAQPEGVTTNLGATIRLCVGVGGVGPFSYQWRLNGAAIAGATDSCLTLPNLQVADSGVYCVTVANDIGAVTSEPVAVVPSNVPPLPPSDSFSGATQLVPANFGVIRGSNLFASKEAGEPDHAGKAGGRSVWYRWFANSGGVTSFNTRGSGFDTLLAVYTGTSVANLTRVASDEDGGGSFTSTLRFNTIQGQTYFVAIDGLAGAEGMFVLQWSSDPASNPLPVIDTPPVSQTVTQGATATFSVSATGTGLSYQWFFFNTPMAGATGPTLTRTDVQAADVGTYVVQVANAFGQFIHSAPVVLEIGPNPGFQSREKLQDLLPGGGFLSPAGLTPPFIPAQGTNSSPPFISVKVGDTTLGQTFNNKGSLGACRSECGAITISTRWVKFLATAAGEFDLDTAGSGIPTILAVYTESVAAEPIEVACDKNNPCHVCFHAKKDEYYYVVVDGAGGATGVIKLNWKVSKPRLDIARAGPNALLSWCTSPGVYQLQSAAELKEPSSDWSPVTNAVSFYRGTNRVTVAIAPAPSKRFFRLCQPSP